MQGENPTAISAKNIFLKNFNFRASFVLQSVINLRQDLSDNAQFFVSLLFSFSNMDEKDML